MPNWIQLNVRPTSLVHLDVDIFPWVKILQIEKKNEKLCAQPTFFGVDKNWNLNTERQRRRIRNISLNMSENENA